jgi:hypothetical protein
MIGVLCIFRGQSAHDSRAHVTTRGSCGSPNRRICHTSRCTIKARRSRISQTHNSHVSRSTSVFRTNDICGKCNSHNTRLPDDSETSGSKEDHSTPTSSAYGPRNTGNIYIQYTSNRRKYFTDAKSWHSTKRTAHVHRSSLRSPQNPNDLSTSGYDPSDAFTYDVIPSIYISQSQSTNNRGIYRGIFDTSRIAPSQPNNHPSRRKWHGLGSSILHIFMESNSTWKSENLSYQTTR